jgi:hypothetical protein
VIEVVLVKISFEFHIEVVFLVHFEMGHPALFLILTALMVDLNVEGLFKAEFILAFG